MPSIQPAIDVSVFTRHLNALYKCWMGKASSWMNADAICIPVGKYEPGWFKSTALQTYLFGFEVPDTIICLTKTAFHVLSSKKKVATFFQPAFSALKDGSTAVALKTHTLSKKDMESNLKKFKTVFEDIKKSGAGTKIAVLLKELKYMNLGSIVPSWMKALDESGLEKVKALNGVATLFSRKDSGELANMKKAAHISSRLFKNGLVAKLEDVIDSEEAVTHEKLSEHIEEFLDKPKSIKANFNPEDGDVDVCFPPILQSGGAYNLKYSAASLNTPLCYDLVIATVGVRYKQYCAKMTRTIMVDPSTTQKKAYKILLDVFERCLRRLKPGVRCNEVHAEARSALEKSEMPSLARHMTKTVGSGIGIEVKDSLNLSAKNKSAISAGMAFDLNIGLKDVPHDVEEEAAGASALKTYSLHLSDTVVVDAAQSEKSGMYCRRLTKFSTSWANVAYYITKNDSEGEEEEEETTNGLSKEDRAAVEEAKALTGVPVTRRARRNTGKQDESMAKAEMRRGERQRELMMELKKKHDKTGSEVVSEDEDVGPGDYIEKKVFKSPKDYPREMKSTAVYVDERKECVFIPINSVPVPFHISTIKSVSKSEGDRAVFLRINFFAPTKAMLQKGRGNHEVVNQVCAKFPLAVFLKDISIRSSNTANLGKQLRLIKELQKRLRTREREQKEMEDIVEQAALKLIRNPPRLQDLSMKPHISGRRTHGTLEAHENGFRFRSVKGEKHDILYSNIRHAIFQPCKNELIVLIHFNLKHPVLINRKKHSNVQFYTEVVEKSEALKKKKRSMYDPDEIDEEQRERKLKRKLNDLFKKFQLKVNMLLEKLSKRPIEFDVPYRKLAFYGTPHKEMVMIQPCTSCLVNLTETPSFVLSLDDIDHVHFERASVSTRTSTFEMVIIRKDHKKEPIRIDAIPSKNLDMLEDWLNEVRKTYTKGPENWNWKQVMKAVIDQELDGMFWKDYDHEGHPKPIGWLFLAPDTGDGEMDDDDSDDAFAPPEESSEEEDDWDPTESDDDDDGESEEEETDAEDWSDMEEEAAADDKRIEAKRKRRDESDRHHKKKRR